MDAALVRLRTAVADIGPAVVAFSGGTDSALVACVAHDTLGPEQALAVTAVSPSLPEHERAACAELASAWGLSWQSAQYTPSGKIVSTGCAQRLQLWSIHGRSS
jgi:PP-loop superfamily ATP-utilizing enzyme